MKLLLFTDSLGLPRQNPENCSLEKTWPYLLKSEGFDIIQCSIGGATSEDLFNQSKYYKAYPCDVVLVQVGIVDCVPRFVGRLEKKIISRIPYVGNKILGLLNSSIVRKIRNLSYVSPKNFEKNLKSLLHNFPPTTDVFFIEIIGGKGYDGKLEGVTCKIEEYNKTLKAVPNSTFIEFSHGNEILTMSDFHHLNGVGHQKLYSAIRQVLSER